MRLKELQRFIRQVLALNFPEPLWVEAEVAEANEVRGHRFIRLVQQEESGKISAQAEAVCWQQDARNWERKQSVQLDQLLQAGQQLRLFVQVDFHERYGLKLVIKDIDLQFTWGQLEQARRATYERLQREALLTQNQQLPLPVSVQRIAVISSSTAAGYQDFWAQLTQNPYRLAYRHTLFDTSMQGDKVARDLPRAITDIRYRSADFDVIVVLRGGGARLDLVAFDQYEVAAAIAQAPLPVLTGIGHDIDQTLSDLCAHTALKTPTAVADFLIQHQYAFTSQLDLWKDQLTQIAQDHIRTQHEQLTHTHLHLRLTARNHLAAAEETLRLWPAQLRQQSQWSLSRRQDLLTARQQWLDSLSIARTLQRGFALLSQKDQLLHHTRQLDPDTPVIARMTDGDIHLRPDTPSP